MNPTGTRVYMLGLSGGLKVIDTASNTVIATVSGTGSYGGVAVNPSGTRVYTADGGGSNLVVADATTNTVLTTVALSAGGSLSGIAVHPDGSRVYVTRSGALSVIDTASNTVVTTVSPLPDQGGAVAVNPSGTRVYAGYFNNCGGCIPGSGGTRTAVIDTATNTEVGSIPVWGAGLAINPAGTRMYAADQTSTVNVIDLVTNTVVTSVPGFYQPAAIAVNPAGTKVYVIQRDTAGVGIIDTATNTWTTTVTGVYNNGGAGIGLFIGPFCPGACSDSNPCTAGICNPISGACSYSNNSASCNDGTFCNGADTCSGGACILHAGDPCAGGPECAQTCNESAGNCFDSVTTACTSDGNVCTDDHCDGAGACVNTANTASCDDGLFCNGADVCAGSTCTHGPNPCTGGSECADACNEAADNCFDLAGTPCTADSNVCTLDQCDGAGACVHPAGNAGTVCRPSAGQCDATETCTGTSVTCPSDGPVPDGTGCIDGDPCTTGEACTGGVCGGGTPNPAGCIDHYLCYKAKLRSPAAYYPFTLADQFETTTAHVRKVKDLCPPANKNGEGIHDAVTHEEAYQIQQDTAHVPQLNLTVTDQFGTLHVDTVKPDRLLVPTNKSLTPPNPDPPAPGVADHYKCYRIKVTSHTTGLTKGTQATVEDQFQTRLYDVRKPKLLCNPVDKNGEGIEHPLAHLMCYQVKTAKGQQRTVPVVGQILTANQFFTETLDTIKEDVLCVPATKTP